MTDIVIAGALRTAIGKFGGTLAKTPAPELGATVIRALLVPALMRLMGEANWWMPNWTRTALRLPREPLVEPAPDPVS